MKKTLVLAGLLALTACQNDESAVDGLYKESGNTINVNDQSADIYNENQRNDSEDFGFVRHQKSPILGENVSNNKYAAINREELADLIAKNCTSLPNVNDVSTLVTSEEVLIVYDTDSKDRELTADQVKRTAMSFVPRWFHVYVSDNTTLQQNVENFATMDANSRSSEHAINKVIQEMKKSPQGRSMGNGENKNGETRDEVDDHDTKDIKYTDQNL